MNQLESKYISSSINNNEIILYDANFKIKAFSPLLTVIFFRNYIQFQQKLKWL